MRPGLGCGVKKRPHEFTAGLSRVVLRLWAGPVGVCAGVCVGVATMWQPSVLHPPCDKSWEATEFKYFALLEYLFLSRQSSTFNSNVGQTSSLLFRLKDTNSAQCNSLHPLYYTLSLEAELFEVARRKKWNTEYSFQTPISHFQYKEKHVENNIDYSY